MMLKNEYRKEDVSVDNVEFPPTAAAQERIKTVFCDIRQGQLMKYLPYVLYLVFLGVLYIGNRHHIDRVIRRIDTTKLEVEELRASYMSAQAAYMYALKRTEVVKKAEALGLKESAKPPEVIYIEK